MIKRDDFFDRLKTVMEILQENFPDLCNDRGTAINVAERILDALEGLQK